MSRKRILNVTSTKKRDTMLSAAWDGAAYVPGPLVLTGGNAEINTIFWAASARLPFVGVEDPGQNNREKSEIYLRGYRCDMQVEITTNQPWEWRRIVFSVKGLGHHLATNDFIAHTFANGYMRGVRELDDYETTDNYYNEIKHILFRGEDGTDWTSEMTAPIRTKNVTVHSDRTRILRSQNSAGHLHKFKQWVPFNRPFTYADSEAGGQMTRSPFGVDSKQGTGDVFFIDFYRTLNSSSATDILNVSEVTTMYWHER